MKDRLLIVGIDPGLSVGYAFLDTSGKVVEIGSAKQFSLSDLISLVINHGQPIAVGCDKKVIPSFVQRFSAKFGCRLLRPKQDVLVDEKKSITKGFSYNNMHEMDALASALLAYKELRPHIGRVENYVKEHGKQEHRIALLKRIIRDPYVSVQNALEVLERKKPEPEEKAVAEPRKIAPEEYYSLLEKHKQLQLEAKMLHEMNDRLEAEIESLKSGGMIRIIQKVDGKAKIEQQKSNANVLRHELEGSRKEAGDLRREIAGLNRLLSLGSTSVLLKKMRNLTFEELQRKRQVLGLRERDVLLVDDPNAISERAVAELRKYVNIILTRVPVSSKLKAELGFIFISAAGLGLLETEHFALADKRQFDSRLKDVNLIREVIESYRKEREMHNG